MFDEIPEKNTFSWNALLIGYSCNGMDLDTLSLFSHWLSSVSPVAKPDHFTVTCVLKSLSSLFPEWILAKMMHCFVIQNGFDSDIFVTNPLITYYLRCDDVTSARTLFDGAPERDVVTWNSMIAGYSHGGYYEDCKRFFTEMLNLEGLRPNGVTILSVLQACAQSNDLALGMDVHRLVVEDKIEIDLSLCNALITLYAKCGSLDYARELFDNMSEKDEITYGTIISGYMVHGFVDKALDLFHELENPGLSTWNAVISGLVQNNRCEGILELFRRMQSLGFRPNSVTLSSILPSLSHLSYMKGGREIHGYAIRNRFDRNIYVATALIDIYAKMGSLHDAQRIFYHLRARTVIVWTTIIAAHAVHGDAYTALDLFDDMLDGGTDPDPVTLTAVLTACGHSGMVDRAWENFDSMLVKYGFEPSLEHYACMVGVLGRAGKLSEAMQFISKMPIEPSAKVWGALLNGASVCGDIEIGKIACEHLFEIEPESTGNYVIMANLYSRAGRWDEAEEIRQRMNSLGLDKVPGNSWIEMSEGLHCFVAKDASNERMEEIYETLNGLIEVMREEGCGLTEEIDEESACD